MKDTTLDVVTVQYLGVYASLDPHFKQLILLKLCS